MTTSLLVAFVAGIVVAELVNWAERYFFDNRPARLVIKGAIMADVGVPFLFTVVATNKAGRVVPDKGVKVSADVQQSGGTPVVAVGDDGSAGSLAYDIEGIVNLTAADAAGLKSAALAVTFADNKPATLTITPA